MESLCLNECSDKAYHHPNLMAYDLVMHHDHFLVFEDAKHHRPRMLSSLHCMVHKDLKSDDALVVFGTARDSHTQACLNACQLFASSTCEHVHIPITVIHPIIYTIKTALPVLSTSYLGV